MCDIPDPKALVVGDGEEVLAARVEGQAAHPVVVAEERRQAQAGRRVPDANGLEIENGWHLLR